MWRFGENPIQGKTRDGNQIPKYVRSNDLDREINTFQTPDLVTKLDIPNTPNAGEASEECRVALVRGTKPGEAKSHRGKKRKRKKGLWSFLLFLFLTQLFCVISRLLGKIL